MLPSTGQISLGNIADEFLKSRVNVKLGDYRRGGTIVRNVTMNNGVPTGNPITIGNFHSAVRYFIKVKFDITAETTSTYANSNNGIISVTVQGVSNNYSVKISTFSAVSTINNSTVTQNSLNSGAHSVIVSDASNGTSYTFSVTVNYGTGTGGSVVLGATSITTGVFVLIDGT